MCCIVGWYLSTILHSVLKLITRYFIIVLAVSTRPPDGDSSRFMLEFSRPLQASVRSFSIHQVAPATAVLLLLLLILRACFVVIRQVSLAWIIYAARIDKWPWPWLKHSLSPYAKFSLDRPSRLAGHRQQTNRDISPFIMYSVSQKIPPTLRTCGNFSKMVGNFSTKFYMPITRSYLC